MVKNDALHSATTMIVVVLCVIEAAADLGQSGLFPVRFLSTVRWFIHKKILWDCDISYVVTNI